MKPEKNTEMYCMMTIFGTLMRHQLHLRITTGGRAHIITACFFIPSMAPSRFAASSGLAGPSASVDLALA